MIGLFVYALVVIKMGHFSGWAGSLSLCLMAVPMIARNTEGLLLLVGSNLREAAYALGASRAKVVTKVLLKACLPGVVTGILLAMARISGEAAPLLFTALNNQFNSFDMNAPMASIPATVFKFALSPYSNWQSLAWAGLFLMIVLVLVLNLFARWVSSRTYN